MLIRAVVGALWVCGCVSCDSTPRNAKGWSEADISKIYTSCLNVASRDLSIPANRYLYNWGCECVSRRVGESTSKAFYFAGAAPWSSKAMSRAFDRCFGRTQAPEGEAWSQASLRSRSDASFEFLKRIDPRLDRKVSQPIVECAQTIISRAIPGPQVAELERSGELERAAGFVIVYCISDDVQAQYAKAPSP